MGVFRLKYGLNLCVVFFEGLVFCKKAWAFNDNKKEAQVFFHCKTGYDLTIQTTSKATKVSIDQERTKELVGLNS